MGERGVFADLAACVSGNAAAGIGCVDELRKLAIGHAGLCGFVAGFVDGEGDVVGELHKSQLCRGLDAATAEGDGRGAGRSEGRARVSDAVCEDKLGTLFDADYSGGDAGFFESFGEKLVRIFVFVPRVDASSGGRREGCGFGFHALADTALFEDGADDEGCTVGGEGPGEEAFGLAPAESGEVVERGAGGDDDGVDAVLVHEGVGTFEALLAFGKSDGDGFGTTVGEGSDGGWKLYGGRLGSEREGWRDGCYGGRG